MFANCCNSEDFTYFLQKNETFNSSEFLLIYLLVISEFSSLSFAILKYIFATFYLLLLSYFVFKQAKLDIKFILINLNTSINLKPKMQDQYYNSINYY